MINQVIKFQNDMVMVFDEGGEQMPQYQGRYKNVKVKILADAPEEAEFFMVYGMYLAMPFPEGSGDGAGKSEENS